MNSFTLYPPLFLYTLVNSGRGQTNTLMYINVQMYSKSLVKFAYWRRTLTVVWLRIIKQIGLLFHLWLRRCVWVCVSVGGGRLARLASRLRNKSTHTHKWVLCTQAYTYTHVHHITHMRRWAENFRSSSIPYCSKFRLDMFYCSISFKKAFCLMRFFNGLFHILWRSSVFY